MEKNASILVVDDDKEIADLVEIYLVNDGYQVLKASDGEQCLQTLKEHPEVRMLILDILLLGFVVFWSFVSVWGMFIGPRGARSGGPPGAGGVPLPPLKDKGLIYT